MNEKDLVRYSAHYDENAFWEKLKKFARKAGIKVTYAALLLFYVLKSPGTSTKDRAKILGSLGYFILPVDLIPDFIPIAGYTDDLKISLAKLVPNGSVVSGHAEYILSGHSAYDNDGALVAGSIQTYDGSYTIS